MSEPVEAPPAWLPAGTIVEYVQDVLQDREDTRLLVHLFLDGSGYRLVKDSAGALMGGVDSGVDSKGIR